jgi:hypothetical protein
MIDWFNLGMNALWIIGCAVFLATISYVSWEASSKHEKFRTRLNQPQANIFLNVAGLLFCLGLAGTTDVTWQRVLWILLAVGFIIQIGATIIKSRSL